MMARITSASRWSVTGKVVPAEASLFIPAARALQPGTPTVADGGSRDVPLDVRGTDAVSTVCGAELSTCWNDRDSTNSDSATPATDGDDSRGVLSTSMTERPSVSVGSPSTSRGQDSDTGSSSENFSTIAQPAWLANGNARQPAATNIAATSATVSGRPDAAIASLPDVSKPTADADHVALAAASAARPVSSAPSSAVTNFSGHGTGAQGSSAAMLMRTPKEPQDLVDTLLALGVVLGLFGVLVVGLVDLASPFVR